MRSIIVCVCVVSVFLLFSSVFSTPIFAQEAKESDSSFGALPDDETFDGDSDVWENSDGDKDMDEMKMAPGTAEQAP